MLMPTKHLSLENSLIGVGAQVLELLPTEKTVSRLFFDLQTLREEREMSTIQFGWYLLALDFLYVLGAVRLQDGLLRKLNQ